MAGKLVDYIIANACYIDKSLGFFYADGGIYIVYSRSIVRFYELPPDKIESYYSSFIKALELGLVFSICELDDNFELIVFPKVKEDRVIKLLFGLLSMNDQDYPFKFGVIGAENQIINKLLEKIGSVETVDGYLDRMKYYKKITYEEWESR